MPTRIAHRRSPETGDRACLPAGRFGMTDDEFAGLAVWRQAREFLSGVRRRMTSVPRFGRLRHRLGAGAPDSTSPLKN
jgi:hypothetical protein